MLFNLSLNNTSAVTWRTVVILTGVGDKTTQIFELTEDARFVWNTTYDNEEWSAFSAWIYEVGSKYSSSHFNGLSGTSYFYQKGEFYIEANTANLNSWEIKIQQKSSTTTPTDGNGDNTGVTSYSILLVLFAVPLALLLRKKHKN